jgi:hypothetical protein
MALVLLQTIRNFGTNVLRVIQQITAMLAPIKKRCSRGVMISAIKTLSCKLFLPFKEALSLFFLQNVACIQVSFACFAASV